MTEQVTETASTQAANGQVPGVPPALGEPDTGEKWLGILLIGAAVLVALMGIDRVTGGKLSALLAGGDAEG